MLQTVLGIDAARIPFRVPEPPKWSECVSFMLDAIYAAYTGDRE